jgi:hypothetical protein
MSALILVAVLHGFISIPPIHVFQPYPDVKCPRGYSVWWPAGKEFDNDRYAECIKPIARPVAKRVSQKSHTVVRTLVPTHTTAPVAFPRVAVREAH